MPVRLRILAALTLLTILAGCQLRAFIPRPEPPAAIRICVTPLLENWLPKLNTCSAGLTQNNLLLELLTPRQHSAQTCDLSLSLGEKNGDVPFLSVPGFETVVVVKNPNNPVESLSLDSLQAVLVGEITAWDQLQEGQTSAAAFSQSIIRIGYEQDHELSRWLNTLAGEDLQTPEPGTMALSTELMLAAVAAEPGALGFTLASQLSQAVSPLPVLDVNGAEIRWQLPVLAVTQTKPQGDLYSLLVCLQSPTQP